MEMSLILLDLPWKKKNGENSFLRIEKKGWVSVMSLQLCFPVV